MEGAINSEIQQEKNSSTCTDVTRGTGSAESTAGAENSAWTFRKIIILASLFLVYFVVNSAYSVYAPFFPSEVSSAQYYSHLGADYMANFSPG